MYPTDIVAILLSFVMGVLLSSLSISLVLLIAFLVIYECIYVQCIYSEVFIRVGVVMAYIAGWIAGRLAQGMDIALFTPEEDIKRFPESHMCPQYAAEEQGFYSQQSHPKCHRPNMILNTEYVSEISNS